MGVSCVSVRCLFIVTVVFNNAIQVVLMSVFNKLLNFLVDRGSEA